MLSSLLYLNEYHSPSISPTTYNSYNNSNDYNDSHDDDHNNNNNNDNDHSSSESHSSSSSSGHIFGQGTHSGGIKLFIGFLICCLYLITMGKFLDSMEKVTNNTPYHSMLHNIYREIMMVGIGLFVFTILHETGYELPYDFYNTYSFVDICCFVMALFFCIQGVFVMVSSLRQAASWDLASKIPTEELQLKVNVTKQSYPILWTLRYLQFSDVRDHVEFRVLHSIFSSVYSMTTKPTEFDFGMYLRIIHENNILSLTHISPAKWLMILFLTAIISLKLVFYHSECHTTHCENNEAIWMFTIGGFISSFFSLILMYFGRLSEIRLLNIAGVEAISDYTVFLMTEVKTRSALQSLMLDVNSIESCLNEIQKDFHLTKITDEMKNKIQQLERYHEFDLFRNILWLIGYEDRLSSENDNDNDNKNGNGNNNGSSGGNSINKNIRGNNYFLNKSDMLSINGKSPSFIEEGEELEDGDSEENLNESKIKPQPSHNLKTDSNDKKENSSKRFKGSNEVVRFSPINKDKNDDSDNNSKRYKSVAKIFPIEGVDDSLIINDNNNNNNNNNNNSKEEDLEANNGVELVETKESKELNQKDIFSDDRTTSTVQGEQSFLSMSNSRNNPIIFPSENIQGSNIQSNNLNKQEPNVQESQETELNKLRSQSTVDDENNNNNPNNNNNDNKDDNNNDNNDDNNGNYESNTRRASRRKDVSVVLIKARSRRRSLMQKNSSQGSNDSVNSPLKKSASFLRQSFRSNSSFRCSWRQSMEDFFNYDKNDGNNLGLKINNLSVKKQLFKDKMLNNHQKQNYEDVFLFGNASLYYWLVDFSFTCNSLYLAWWVLNFIFVTLDTESNQSKKSYLVILSLLPSIISFISLTFAIRSTTLLRGLTKINILTLIKVMKLSQEKTSLLNDLRTKILNKIENEIKWVTSPLLERMLNICREYSSDGMTLTRSEFMRMLLNYDIIYSQKELYELYDAIDVNGGRGIEIGELKEFLFPNDISIENQRREKMFNQMNSKALRSTANKDIAKRIIQFIDPKNIVNNPRRISRGSYDFLEKINRKFSLRNENGESKEGIKDITKDDLQQQ